MNRNIEGIMEAKGVGGSRYQIQQMCYFWYIYLDFKSAYAQFDGDNDERITIKEFGDVIRSMGQNPTEAEIQQIVQNADLDSRRSEFILKHFHFQNPLLGNDTLDFSEFCKIMAKAQNELGFYTAKNPVEDLKAAFQVRAVCMHDEWKYELDKNLLY